ncbi:MAG: VWA domain-containing protein, partial [Gammaproteobacteria bacterium]
TGGTWWRAFPPCYLIVYMAVERRLCARDHLLLGKLNRSARNPCVIDSTLAEFHFLRPWFLLALVPFALIVWFGMKQRTRAGLWEDICDPELIPYVTEKPTRAASRLHYLAIVIGLGVILALAGPTWQKLPTPVFRQDSALVIVLDLSRSMNAEDVKPSRLERAKFKISDILRLRKDGQTALLVFAEQPYIVTPLTNDARTIENHLPALTTDVMPSQGSNLIAAIEKASELLIQAGIRGGDILILTDTMNTDSSVVETLVKDQDIRISVLGIGTQQGAPVTNDRGSFIADESGNVILMTMDVVGLRELATTGNGLYQSITSDDKDIERFVRFVDSKDTGEAESSSDLFADRWREFGPWLLVGCLPLIPLLFRRGLLVSLLAFNFAVLSPGADAQSADEIADGYWFFTPDQAGGRAFQKGEYEQAQSHFQHDGWRAAAAYRGGDFESATNALSEPQSAQEWYNKGNALARLGEFDEAIAAYEQAINEVGEHEDATYNKALLEKLLEEQQQQQQNEGEGENSDSDGEQDAGGESEGETDDASQSEQKGGDSSAESDEMSEQQQEEQATQNSEENQEEQEQQAAEEQANESQKGEQDGGKPNDTMADAQPEPNAELEQATEQWLRQIPDDPGGLLRRKFEYEHQRQGFKRNSGGQQW